MKVALAQFIYESNTFNPAEAGIELFTQGGTWLTTESSVRDWCTTTDSQMSGSLAVLEDAGCTTHPVFVAMCGTPSGRLSAECLRAIRAALLAGLRAAGSVDAMLLHLHGAVCAVGEDDVEGNLLAMVRQELAFAGRIVVSLDLHANVTRRMLTHADAVTAYRTMPHLDFRSTGERAARLLLDPRRTVRTLAKVAALIPPTDTNHAGGRFAEILRQASQIEELPGMLDVSVFPVQPWMDVAEMGSSVVITAVTGTPAAQAARALGETWYAQREQWQTGLRPWTEIRTALKVHRPRPWVLVDSADATTGGSDGTSAEAVQQLWAVRDDLPGDVLLWVVDETACAAAERDARDFHLGRQDCEVQAQVVWTGEGRYRARGRAYTGQEFSMGRAAVLRAGRLHIVVSSRGALGADPAFYECVGLAPDRALAVQVKSMMGWRAGYDAGAEQGLVFDGPGHTSLTFAGLPFTGERRELFPLMDSNPCPVTLWQSI